MVAQACQFPAENPHKIARGDAPRSTSGWLSYHANGVSTCPSRGRLLEGLRATADLLLPPSVPLPPLYKYILIFSSGAYHSPTPAGHSVPATPKFAVSPVPSSWLRHSDRDRRSPPFAAVVAPLPVRAGRVIGTRAEILIWPTVGAQYGVNEQTEGLHVVHG